MLFKDLDRSVSDLFYGADPKGIREAVSTMYRGWNTALVNFFRKKQSDSSDPESAAQDVWVKMLILTQEQKRKRPDLRDLFWSVVRRVRSRRHAVYVCEKDGIEGYVLDIALSGGGGDIEALMRQAEIGGETATVDDNCNSYLGDCLEDIRDCALDSDDDLATTTDSNLPNVSLWDRWGGPRMFEQHGRFFSAGGCSITDHQEAEKKAMKRQADKKRRAAYDRKRFQDHKAELMAKHNAAARKKTADRRNAIEQLKLLRGQNADRNQE